MSKAFKVAVVGATGAVGEVMLAILAERKFPISELVALASARSAGEEVKFGNRDVVVRDLATFDPAASYRPIFRRRFDFQGIRTEVRCRGRGGDRQLLGVPLRRRRAAGGERSQSGAGRQPPARHHRQSQLFDHADGGGAGADPSPGRHRAAPSRPINRLRTGRRALE